MSSTRTPLTRLSTQSKEISNRQVIEWDAVVVLTKSQDADNSLQGAADFLDEDLDLAEQAAVGAALLEGLWFGFSRAFLPLLNRSLSLGEGGLELVHLRGDLVGDLLGLGLGGALGRGSHRLVYSESKPIIPTASGLVLLMEAVNVTILAYSWSTVAAAESTDCRFSTTPTSAWAGAASAVPRRPAARTMLKMENFMLAKLSSERLGAMGRLEADKKSGYDIMIEGCCDGEPKNSRLSAPTQRDFIESHRHRFPGFHRCQESPSMMSS